MDPIPLECAKCKVERDHDIRIEAVTQSSVKVTARCAACGNTITLPISGLRLRHGETMEDRVREILGVGHYKRAIRRGKPSNTSDV